MAFAPGYGQFGTVPLGSVPATDPTGGDAIHRNLMINSVPPTWTNVDIKEFFLKYGPIEEAKVIMDKATGESKGYGFVKFVNRDDAERVLVECQGVQVLGKELKIQKAGAGKGPSGPVSLYMAGFDPNTFGLNELRALLAPYGTPIGVRVHPSQAGKRGGVAFVSMDSWAGATAAAEALNGVNIGGNPITIRIAEASLKQAQTGQATDPAAQLAAQRFAPYARKSALVGGAPTNSAQAAQLQQAMLLQQQQAYALQLMQYQQMLPMLQQPALVGAVPAAGVAAVPAAGATTGYSITVSGVEGMDDTFLHKLFDQFGTVTSTNAPANVNYAYVTMADYAQAQNAIQVLNGCTLQGAAQPLQVSFTKS